MYSIYKGDELIAVGNVIELAEQLNISPTTIYFYASSVQKRRTAGKEKNRRIAIKVDDEDE